MKHVGTYPPNWREIAYAAKERAGWRCERCRHPDEPPWKIGGSRTTQWNRLRDPFLNPDNVAFQRAPSVCDELCSHPPEPDRVAAYIGRGDHLAKQRMLTVHHLDLNKSNCADWNLAALCQGCHLTIQAKVHFDQAYQFDHTPWMQWHVDGMEAAKAALMWPVPANAFVLPDPDSVLGCMTVHDDNGQVRYSLIVDTGEVTA